MTNEIDTHLLDILASLPDPAFVLTLSGRYAGVFGGKDTRYYHDGSSLVGKSMSEVLVPAKVQWFLGEIRKALDTQGIHITEYTLSGSDVLGLKDDGPSAPIWFEGRVSKLNFTVNNEPTVLWVAHNITANIATQTQLMDALKREREAINSMWRKLSVTPVASDEDSWILDTVRKTLSSGHDKVIALTPNETQLLQILSRVRGSIVPKSMLMEKLFPATDVDTSKRIDVAISRLKQKLRTHQCKISLRAIYQKGIVLEDPIEIK